MPFLFFFEELIISEASYKNMHLTFQINSGIKKLEKGKVMKLTAFVCATLFLVLMLASCAPGPNQLEKTPNEKGKVAGFWRGFWHGLISPITFIISLFTKNVRIYEVHNNGNWYNFGFVLGAGLFLQGGILGSRKARRK